MEFGFTIVIAVVELFALVSFLWGTDRAASDEIPPRDL